MEIKFKHGNLKIYNDYGIECYNIPQSNLGATIHEDDVNLSLWISQLKQKNWVEDYLLYNLAVAIQKFLPNNKIDWLATFFSIEKKEYLTSTCPPLESSSKSLFDRALARIEFNRSRTDAEIDDAVTEIVKKKLQRLGVTI